MAFKRREQLLTKSRKTLKKPHHNTKIKTKHLKKASWSAGDMGRGRDMKNFEPVVYLTNQNHQPLLFTRLLLVFRDFFVC